MSDYSVKNGEKYLYECRKKGQGDHEFEISLGTNLCQKENRINKTWRRGGGREGGSISVTLIWQWPTG